MTNTYRLAWLYPDLLELYGDSGNITLLRRRAEQAGLDLSINQFSVGDTANLESYDFIFLGGGSDREQQIFYKDLMGRKQSFLAAIESNVTIVLICGGYQLFGSYYEDLNGAQLEGLGIFDYWTKGAKPRTIGYLVTKTEVDGVPIQLAGFENHSGLTYNVSSPLAQVIQGVGNNHQDDTEGVAYRNLIGTYMHGPLFARNPNLVDSLIYRMATRRGHEIKLPQRESNFEQLAHDQVLREFKML